MTNEQYAESSYNTKLSAHGIKTIKGKSYMDAQLEYNGKIIPRPRFSPMDAVKKEFGIDLNVNPLNEA